MDKDFSRVVRFPPDKCGGIIVVKLYKIPIEKATEIFRQYYKFLDEGKIKGRLVIINREGIRIKTFKKL